MEIFRKSKLLRSPSWSTFFTSAGPYRGTSWSTFSPPGVTPGVTWGLLPESPWGSTWLAPGPVLAAVLAGGPAGLVSSGYCRNPADLVWPVSRAWLLSLAPVSLALD